MEQFLTRLATMIRSSREAQSLTQEKLGDLVSIDQSMVGNYERGRAKPRIDTLYHLVRVLNLDVNELFYGQSAQSDGPAEQITGLVKQLDADSQQEVLEYIKYLQWKNKSH